GATPGEPAPGPAAGAGSALSAPGPGDLPPVWLCLLWETGERGRRERQAPGICLLPLYWRRRLPVWGRTPLSQWPGAHRSAGGGGLGRSAPVAGKPAAARSGISAAAPTIRRRPGGAGTDPLGSAGGSTAAGTGAADRQLCR